MNYTCYLVQYMLEGKGAYIPPDPGSSGGDRYGDLHAEAFITCRTPVRAREIVLLAHPMAKILHIRSMGQV